MKSDRNEEQGTFWVFIWPQLVPWPNEISWIFCPPGRGGRTPWRVGDLWGVDTEGNLIIVENKIRKNRESPLEKFVNHTVPSFDALKDHWLTRFAAEKELRKRYPSGLGPDFPQRKNDPGLGPCSLGFIELRRWPDLDRQFVTQFESGSYEAIVNQNLDRYQSRRGKPHYFGLFTLFDDDEVRPYLKYYDELVNRVGENHVHVFAVQRRTVFNNGRSECRICSYRVGVRTVSNTNV